MSTGGPFSA